MDQHRFKAFLRSRQGNDPLARKFVDDALADRELPDAGSWQELEGHLVGREAPAETLDAAEYVWQQYEAVPPGRER